MSRRNAQEKKIVPQDRGCPRSCARTNPWFRGRNLGEKRTQEPPPGSAVEHCQFPGTGGGGRTSNWCQGSRFTLPHMPQESRLQFLLSIVDLI